jgi:hypothetical protein
MSSVPKVALGAGFGVFLVIIAALLAPTVIKPRVATFLPTVGAGVPADGKLVTDTLTVDAGDENHWRFVDLDRGAILSPPDTAGWDLMLRRFHFVASGAMANLGRISYDSLVEAPDTGYVPSRFMRDTANVATDHWYSYSYFSHLLEPRGDVYAVRTREGHYAKIQILSYYCPGPTPGCVTFRYWYQGDGGRRLSPNP